MRWYPPGENPYDLDTECFDGLLGERNGKLVSKPKLNPERLRDRFIEKYLDSVRSMWDEDKKRKAGAKNSKPLWVQVPVGNSYSHGIPEHVKTTEKVRFFQKNSRTCMIQSFASACYYLGWRNSANKLSTIKHQFIDQPFQIQIALLQQEILKRIPELSGKFEIFQDDKRLDIFGNKSRNPTLVVPVGSDGGTQHAITVVDNLIFDSNVEVALRLCQDSLDWCTNAPRGFHPVHYAIRFQRKHKNRKLCKRERIRRREKDAAL